MTTEKRQNIRHVLKNEVLMCKVLPDIEGRLLNICSTGACVGSDKQLTVGDKQKIQLNNGGHSVNLKGVVIWEITEGSGDDLKCQAGLKFVDMNEQDKTALDHLLAAIVKA